MRPHSAVVGAPRAARPLPAHWAEEVRQLHLWARGGQWLRYRDSHAAMADALLRRGRELEALEHLLEVWYVDLNGPRNAVPPREALLATEAPRFNPALGATRVQVRRQVRRLITQLDLDVDDVQVLFFATTSTTYRRYELPLSPSRAWPAVGAQLLD